MSDPILQNTPVVIASADPAAASQGPPPPSLVNPSDAKIAESDRKTASQREINLVWENTQMRIALSVIWAALLVSSVLAVAGRMLGTPDIQLAAIVFLFGVANLVTGFYFGRTNHQRSGGVGGDNVQGGR